MSNQQPTPTDNEIFTNKLEVRAARPEDVFGIHATLLKALAAGGTPYPEPDMPYCIQAMLDQITEGFIAISVASSVWTNEPGRKSPFESLIVGCIWLDYARWPWTSPKNHKGFHLYNQHFWVEPEFRKGGTAKKLLTFATDVADRKSLPLVLSFSNMDVKHEVRDRFARINGFSYTGGVFYREPTP